METKKREVWLDWMRVIACFMVMIVHSTEPFYLGGAGSMIASAGDAWWAAFFDSSVRSCVPIFLVASSYLLFPLRQAPAEFFRRRAVRVLVPFVIWTVVYAFAFGEPVQNFKDLVFNFNYSAGHLWFVYMIMGIYLMMPLLSPWAERVGKKELLVYLGIWLFTTSFPFIRTIMAGDGITMVFGPSGLPNPGRYPLWGEASWNSYGTFYYISGMVGYLMMGLYFRKFVGELSWRRTIAVALPMWLVGFAITSGSFISEVYRTTGGVFPFEGPVNIAAVYWEMGWMYDSTGVALMTAGAVLMFRKIKSDGWFYGKVVLPVSKASYGMYLGHMLILILFAGLFRGMVPTPACVVLTAVCSYTCTAVAALLLRRIPKVGGFIVG